MRENLVGVGSLTYPKHVSMLYLLNNCHWSPLRHSKSMNFSLSTASKKEGK